MAIKLFGFSIGRDSGDEEQANKSFVAPAEEEDGAIILKLIRR